MYARNEKYEEDGEKKEEGKSEKPQESTGEKIRN